MAEPKDKFHYGGQAIIEGVMMRGPKDFGVAVRRVNGEIVTTKENVDSILGKFKWLNKPFLRGTLALIDSMALGMKALMYSANVAMADATEAEGDPGLTDAAVVAPAVASAGTTANEPAQHKPDTVNNMAISVIMVLGMLMGLAIFFFVPIVLTKLLRPAIGASWQLTVVEGLIKISLFVGYVLLVSQLKDIRRVFQYHGAEHKTINCYEAGEELTVDNVMKHTKVHVRCGTSFILVVLVTSILVFMIVADHLPHGSLTDKSVISYLARWLYKLALLPIVAGIAYEVIRFAGNFKDSFLTKLLTFPGLLMQKITTREPEPTMVEVAIKSLECVLERESERRETEAQSA